MAAPTFKLDARIYKAVETYLPEHRFKVLNHLDYYQSRSPGLPLPISIRTMEHEFNLYKHVPCLVCRIYRIQNFTLFLNSKEEMSAIFWGVGSSVAWGKESLRLPIAARSLKFFKKNWCDGQRLPSGKPDQLVVINQ